MRFAYMGQEPEVEIFGFRFKRGEPVSVNDPAAIAKLSTHPQFVSDMGDDPQDAVVIADPIVKRRGRPPKVQP